MGQIVSMRSQEVFPCGLQHQDHLTLPSCPIITGWGLKALLTKNLSLEKDRKGRKGLKFMENHLNCVYSLLILTVTPEQRFESCDAECFFLCCALCVCACVCVHIFIIIKDLYQNLFEKAVSAFPSPSQRNLKAMETMQRTQKLL